MMTDQIRTFVACELPREIRFEIGHIQENLKHRRLRLKWVRPENLHLTLKFLGDVPIERIDTIADAIGKAACDAAPMSLSAKGIGVFPGIRRPRVLWVGIGGQFSQLGRLQAAVAGELADVGFPAEKRPYKGHLTIGRIKAAVDSRQLAAALTELSDFETASFRVDEVVLFRSQLKPDGPIYSRLRTVKLDPH
jgi:2'-5' RNA ligase